MTKTKADARLLGFKNMLTAALGEQKKEEEQFDSQPQPSMNPFTRMLEASELGGTQNVSAYIKHQPSTPEHPQQSFEVDPTTFIDLYDRMCKRIERMLNNQKSDGLLSNKFVHDSHIHNLPSTETSRICGLEDGQSLITLQGFDYVKVTRRGNRLVTSFADVE